MFDFMLTFAMAAMITFFLWSGPLQVVFEAVRAWLSS